MDYNYIGYSYNPTKTPTVILVSHSDDVDSIPEMLLDEVFTTNSVETISFKVKRFSDISPKLWDLIDLVNGMVIDDLAMDDLCVEYKERKISRHSELRLFLRRLLNHGSYNGCPILASIRGFSATYTPLLVFLQGMVITTLEKAGHSFMVKEGDILGYVPGERVGDKGSFVRQNLHTHWREELRSFLHKVRNHHSDLWHKFNINLNVFMRE